MEQVDALDAKASQLAPTQPTVGSNQDQRPIPGTDGSARAATWATVANRISGARSCPAPLTVEGLRSR
jgi:hypothetical protein